MDRDISARTRPPFHPWIIGGILLLGAVLADAARAQLPYFAWLSIAGTLAFAAALVVFAVGFGGRGRVSRNPAATAVLIALAAWTVLARVVVGVLPDLAPADSMSPVGYVIVLGQFVLAVAASVLVARGGELPDPWRWSPLWTVAVVAVAWTLGQLAASVRPTASDLIVGAGAVSVIVSIGALLFLGGLAIALGSSRGIPSERSS